LAKDLDALDETTLTGSINVGGMTEGEHTVSLELNLDSKYKLAKNAAVTLDIVPAGSSQKNSSGSNINKTDTQTGGNITTANKLNSST
jgi:hypothetical protein